MRLENYLKSFVPWVIIVRGCFPNIPHALVGEGTDD